MRAINFMFENLAQHLGNQFINDMTGFASIFQLFRIPTYSLVIYLQFMSIRDFQILNKLGSGSFGIVFKAKRKDNGEICVVKEVDLSKMDKKMKEWTLNEAKIMKEIDSQYIVKYFSSFIQKGKFYISMEYCSGGDLAQFLKAQIGKPISEELIWKFTLQIMLGLRDLHAKKILHRDIKSLNVFLTQNKRVRIGDLGVARTMNGDFANTIVGTPYYLSPEMCEERPYNQKTDVWAMGCLVYELCTGRHPFEANNQAALALKIVVGKYQALPSHYSSLMSWLIKLCLSVDYKRRPTIQYLLSQQDVINMSNKVGISLQPIAKIVTKQQQKIEPIKINKQVQKIVKQQAKPPVKNIVKNVEVKPSSYKYNRDVQKKEEEKRNSIERNRSKSNGGNDKVQKQIKKQVKPVFPQQKYCPPKDNKKSVNDFMKKPQLKQKKSDKLDSPIISKIQEQKPSKIVQKQIINVAQKKQSPKQLKQQKQDTFLIDSKPKGRNSVQISVDDDELFRDFGITPQKIQTLQQKIDFKKINTINWNIGNQKQQSEFSKSDNYNELPTIKTTSHCQLVAVQSKQMDDDDMVEEQIDDNAPYKSDSQTESMNNENGDSLLLEDDMDEIEEEGQLKKKQKIILMEKKIVENQKRRKQLCQLKKQSESDLLGKMDKEKVERIKKIVREGSEEEINKIVMKQIQNGAGMVKFYKIFHFQMQIDRCDENISKCKEHIATLLSK